MDAHAGSRARVTSLAGLYDAATLRALMCKVRTVCGFADLPIHKIQNVRCVFREKECNEDLPAGMKGIRLFRKWFGCKMNIRQSPAKTMCQFAVSEDRTHDLRIMRPTRYQLRYHRYDDRPCRGTDRRTTRHSAVGRLGGPCQREVMAVSDTSENKQYNQYKQYERTNKQTNKP